MIMRTLILRAIICATAVSASRLEMCKRGMPKESKTCLVDGDTIWLNRIKYSLEGFDTPEPHSNLCGGRREQTLAKRASERLLDMLNTHPWALFPSGKLDRHGRGIATIRINGLDVGDVLIDEGLARRWPDGDEFWCN